MIIKYSELKTKCEMKILRFDDSSMPSNIIIIILDMTDVKMNFGFVSTKYSYYTRNEKVFQVDNIFIY